MTLLDPAVLVQPTSARLHVDLLIRACEQKDLEHLEWFGLFREHRHIFAEQFERHKLGENLMIVADVNGFPIGQVWLDLAKKRDEQAGVLWALRIIPWMQNHGIGSRLIKACEALLSDLGYLWIELGVELSNPNAKRLYERHGYQVTGSSYEEYTVRTPDGVAATVPVNQWILRKPLSASPEPLTPA